MLQHNRSARGAHMAHATVMGLHALCCGLPAAAMAAAALSGAASGATLFSDFFTEFHGFLQGHEIWILMLSAGLVGVGGALELSNRRADPGFPWLFSFSAFCFLVNAAIILIHNAR